MRSVSFQALIDLVNFDSHVREVRDSIDKINKQIEAIELNIVAQEREKQKKIDALLHAKKNIDTAELDLASLDQILQEKKRLLETRSDFKEFRSLKHEIEMVGHQICEQEAVVENAWSVIEQTEPIYNEHIKNLGDIIAQMKDELIVLHDAVTRYNDELAVYLQGRADKESCVPQDWLLKYNGMQARVSDPVVPVENDSCSACFSYLTGNNLLQAKRGGLIQCSSCYRLLFLPSAINDK